MAVDDAREKRPAGSAAGEPQSEDRLDPVATFVAGVRTVLDHRIILVAAVPLLVWHLLATALGFNPEPPVIATVVADVLGGRGAYDWWYELATAPERLLLMPLAGGVAIALALGAQRGRPALLDATRAAWHRFPRLAAVAAAGWAASELPGLALGVGWLRLPLAAVALYLLLRVWLAAPAVLADDAPAAEALVRSWRITGGDWWRIFAVALLATVPAIVAAGLLPPWLTAAVGYAWQPVADTVMTTAYLRVAARDRTSTPATSWTPASGLASPGHGSRSTPTA